MDLDFVNTINCIQIPLDKLLKKGYSTGHGFLRSPATTRSAAALTCIGIQSSQNDFFGGQSIPLLDYYLAPYVAKSLARNIAEYMSIKYDIDKDELKEIFTKKADRIINETVYEDVAKVETTTDPAYLPRLAIHRLLKEITDEYDISHVSLDKVIDKAQEMTQEDTNQALEALVHNLCSMQSRSGGQTPFSSVNFGTDTTWEGRCVSKSLLKAIDNGLGMHETAIFPISIFRMMKGVTDKGSPNYDLFRESCRVSSRRLFPNFENQDAPYNMQYYKGIPETLIATMGMFDKGIVHLKYKDSEFNGDITRVKAWLKEVGAAGDSIKFDEYTNYWELEGVSIWDDSSLVRDDKFIDYSTAWVNCKKYMESSDPTRKWVKILVTRFSKQNTYQQKWISNLTTDHPLPIWDEESSTFKRTLVQDIKPGDRIQSDEGSEYPWIVTLIEGVDVKEGHLGYDFETASDKFSIDDFISHNCRTRVISNVFNPEKAIVPGRGNLFWTTISLPYIALEVKEKYPNLPEDKLIEEFLHRLNWVMDEVIDYSYDRVNFVSTRRAKNFPFSMGQQEYVDSEKIGPEDEIREVIKNGTISIGFIGLAETLIALCGKHHGESEHAQELGLRIVKFMRNRCDEESDKTHLNFSLMASPAEGCTGRLLKCIKKRFGDIPRITDKKYLVNSSHVPPRYKINAFKKIDIEAPYHALENAG